MAVAAIGLVGVFAFAPGEWTVGPVGAGWVEFAHEPWQEVEVVAGAPGLVPDALLPRPFGVGRGVAPRFVSLHALVSAAPEDDAGMAAEAGDLVAGLGFDELREQRLLRVAGAGMNMKSCQTMMPSLSHSS